jgi:hypothetical protein
MTATRRRFVGAGAVLFVVAMAFSRPASACRCKKPSPRLAYRLADAVVMGSVESQQSQGDATVTTVVVEHVWKHAVPRRIEVTSTKTCGFSFVTAGRYIVFLIEQSADSFGTRRCRGNVAVSGDGGDVTLRWLRGHAKDANIE